MAIPLEPVETAPGFYEAAWRSRGPLFVAKSDRGGAKGLLTGVGEPPSGAGEGDRLGARRALRERQRRRKGVGEAETKGTWDKIGHAPPMEPVSKEGVRGSPAIFFTTAG